MRSDQQSLLERDAAALVEAKTSSIVVDSGAERQRRWFRDVRENAHLRDPLNVAPKTCSASGTGPKMTESVTKCCSRIASRIAKHEGAPSLRHAIIKPWISNKCSLASTLRTTCESQKPPSEVSFRNVHASVGFPLAGVARWEVQQLRRKLRKCNHLLNNSGPFAGSLNEEREGPRQQILDQNLTSRITS